jgi:hypothetical protein
MKAIGTSKLVTLAAMHHAFAESFSCQRTHHALPKTSAATIITTSIATEILKRKGSPILGIVNPKAILGRP